MEDVNSDSKRSKLKHKLRLERHGSRRESFRRDVKWKLSQRILRRDKLLLSTFTLAPIVLNMRVPSPTDVIVVWRRKHSRVRTDETQTVQPATNVASWRDALHLEAHLECDGENILPALSKITIFDVKLKRAIASAEMDLAELYLEMRNCSSTLRKLVVLDKCLDPDASLELDVAFSLSSDLESELIRLEESEMSHIQNERTYDMTTFENPRAEPMQIASPRTGRVVDVVTRGICDKVRALSPRARPEAEGGGSRNRLLRALSPRAARRTADVPIAHRTAELSSESPAAPAVPALWDRQAQPRAEEGSAAARLLRAISPRSKSRDAVAPIAVPRRARAATAVGLQHQAPQSQFTPSPTPCSGIDRGAPRSLVEGLPPRTKVPRPTRSGIEGLPRQRLESSNTRTRPRSAVEALPPRRGMFEQDMSSDSGGEECYISHGREGPGDSTATTATTATSASVGRMKSLRSSLKEKYSTLGGEREEAFGGRATPQEGVRRNPRSHSAHPTALNELRRFGFT